MVFISTSKQRNMLKIVYKVKVGTQYKFINSPMQHA